MERAHTGSGAARCGPGLGCCGQALTCTPSSCSHPASAFCAHLHGVGRRRRASQRGPAGGVAQLYALGQRHATLAQRHPLDAGHGPHDERGVLLQHGQQRHHLERRAAKDVGEDGGRLVRRHGLHLPHRLAQELERVVLQPLLDDGEARQLHLAHLNHLQGAAATVPNTSITVSCVVAACLAPPAAPP